MASKQRALGIALQKERLRYVLLSLDAAKPSVLESRRLLTTDPEDVPALMDWFDTQFTALIAATSPAILAYRMPLEPKKAQIQYLEFPLGILNLIAHKKGLPIYAYTNRQYAPKRLELHKSTDLESHCDLVLGKHPPYWDTYQRQAALGACRG